MNRPFTHQPVLLGEVLQAIPEHAKVVVDCTLGGGGHAAAILEHLPACQLIGIDRDPHALEAAKLRLEPFAERVRCFHARFSEIDYVLARAGVKADFILADVGVSSPQFDQAQRGFSFLHDGPLDMRMDPDDPVPTAKELLNEEPASTLAEWFATYGEERFAMKIAKAIERTRTEAPIERTHQLADLVFKAIPRKFHKKGFHPATKVFQALRIVVNSELEQLEDLLRSSVDLLTSRGRVAIISFHSLEDRRVKQAYRSWEKPCQCPTEVPFCDCGKACVGRAVTRSPITAESEEVRENPRSRSAKLRVFQRV